MTAPLPHSDDPVEDAFRNLFRSGSIVRGKIGEHFAEFRLSGTQWGVLRVLQRAEEAGEVEVRQNDLVERMLVTPPAITGVIGRLEKMRLVNRTMSAGDRRARVIKLTAEGRRLMKKVLRRHNERVHAVMAALNEKEIAQLNRLLGKLSGHVTRMAEGFER